MALDLKRPEARDACLKLIGGGAMYLALGLLAGLLHARATAAGQVVDAAMSDGAASLMATFYGHLAGGRWTDTRESNGVDGGAPYYGVYRSRREPGRWRRTGARKHDGCPAP